jgi:type VI secretion system protein ImpK
MMTAARDNSYLIEQLLEFHTALVRIKRGLATPSPQPALAGPDGQPDLPNALQLGQTVRDVLDLQSAEAEDVAGRHGREQAEAARYLKVALADEVLIAVPHWPQRQAWIACPLEYQLYGTRCAGERIFDRIALLLQEQPPVRRDLAVLYLMALSMGFQGRYRKQEGGPAALQVWRRELYHYGFRRWPDRIFAGMRDEERADLGPRLMPQPYSQTRANDTARLLPNPRRWALYFVLVVLGMLLLSQLVWQADTDALAAQLATAGKQQIGAAP